MGDTRVVVKSYQTIWVVCAFSFLRAKESTLDPFWNCKIQMVGLHCLQQPSKDECSPFKFYLLLVQTYFTPMILGKRQWIGLSRAAMLTSLRFCNAKVRLFSLFCR